MSLPERYPLADWRGDGNSGGDYRDEAEFCVCWHTTETRGVPGYNGGDSAPHLTYQPLRHVWHQHTSLLTAARALRNPAGGVQTNREKVIQVELVCYSNRRVAGDYGRLYVGDLDDQALDDLALFSVWVFEEFGVRLEYSEKPFTNSRCSGASSPCRMTRAEWVAFDAHADHAQVPENTHYDANALRGDEIMRRATAILGGITLPAPPAGGEDGMYREVHYGDGTTSDPSQPVADWQNVIVEKDPGGIGDFGPNGDGVDGIYRGAVKSWLIAQVPGSDGMRIGPTTGAYIFGMYAPPIPELPEFPEMPELPDVFPPAEHAHHVSMIDVGTTLIETTTGGISET